jgi:hypothetical protein
MSWIQEVLDAYSESEAPPKFFYWSALSAISAIVRKNVYLDMQHYILRPNIYVMIVADSGTKKGIPVNLAKEVVKRLKATRIITGRISLPQVLKDLGKLHHIDSTRSIKEAHAFLVSGELSSFLVRDNDALNILTDLYNCHENEEEWVNSLKSTGIDKLLAPCLTILGASNEDLLEDVITQKDVKGGFIARTFIVSTQEKGTPNSLLRPLMIKPDKQKLANSLERLLDVKGEFVIDPDAIEYCESWYNKLFKLNINDKTHTIGRLEDKVLKVAMLLALAEGNDLIIKKSHMMESIYEVDLTWHSARQVMLGSGKDVNLSYKLKLVFRALVLKPNHTLTRRELMQRFMGDIDHFDLDRIIEMMLAADCIKVLYPNTGRAEYTLKENALKLFDSMEKEVKKEIV